MKRFRSILYILSLILLCSCGEDRTAEYISLIEGDKWIETTMSNKYLWYDNMSSVNEDDYFADPADFLQKILFKGNDSIKADQFSYVEMKTTTSTSSRSYLQKTSTYGFDFELITDPTQTTNHTLARVLFVLPNSPASEAGLKRGDWISKVNNSRVTVNNYGYLMEGDATTFTTKELYDTDNILSWSSEQTISITASRVVENNPFYIDTTYVVDGNTISYLVYNEFSTGPDNMSTDTQYFTEMKQIFARFKSQSPDAFILDLRYNPGGYLTCAQQLASMLAPSDALGKTFLTLKYNNITSPQTLSYNFSNELSSYNLNLSNIYIITSSFTASASEAIINCLRPYMGEANVITIGETTVGKNVAMEPYTEDKFDFIIWPVVAYVLNADNSSNYSNGITPTYTISERTYYQQLLPLGNTDELLLKNTISLITTGSIPQTSDENISNTSKIKSSISYRHPIGMKLK